MGDDWGVGVGGVAVDPQEIPMVMRQFWRFKQTSLAREIIETVQVEHRHPAWEVMPDNALLVSEAGIFTGL